MDDVTVQYVPELEQADHAAPPASGLISRLLLVMVILWVSYVNHSEVASGMQLAISQVLSLGLVIMVFLSLLGGGGGRIPAEMLWSTSALLLFGVGFLIARDRELFLLLFEPVVKSTVLGFAIMLSVRSRRDFLWSIAVIFALPLLVVGTNVAPSATATSDIVREAGGTGDANTFAIFALLGVTMSLALVLATPMKWLRYLWLLPLPVFLKVITASGSRSAMLSVFAIAVGLYWLLWRPEAKRRGTGSRVMALVGGTALVLAVGAILASGPFWWRLQETFGWGEAKDTGGTFETEYRARAAVEGTKLFFRNPLLGVGYGNFRERIADVAPELAGAASHNTWVEAAVSAGIPGLILVAGLWVTAVRRALRLRKNPHLPALDRQLVAIGLTVIMVFLLRSMFFIVLGDKMVIMTMGVLIGYFHSLERQYGSGHAEVDNGV